MGCVQKMRTSVFHSQAFRRTTSRQTAGSGIHLPQVRPPPKPGLHLLRLRNRPAAGKSRYPHQTKDPERKRALDASDGPSRSPCSPVIRPLAAIRHPDQYRHRWNGLYPGMGYAYVPGVGGRMRFGGEWPIPFPVLRKKFAYLDRTPLGNHVRGLYRPAPAVRCSGENPQCGAHRGCALAGFSGTKPAVRETSSIKKKGGSKPHFSRTPRFFCPLEKRRFFIPGQGRHNHGYGVVPVLDFFYIMNK